MIFGQVSRSIRYAGGFGVALLMAMMAGSAQAQTLSSVSALTNYYSDFLSVQKPPGLGLTLFGGGFVSDQYATLQEGFQLEQTVTHHLGVVARATGYQLFMGQGFANPLAPSATPSSRYNFGRFQGGLDIGVLPNTHLYLLGGGDAGDSSAPNIEGDISNWLFVHSHNPLNILISAVHDWQNGVTSSSIDLRAVVLSTEDYLLMAGGGGAIYGGGFVSDVAGQGGPDLGVYYRPWEAGIDAQAGYGSAHQYGQIVLYKQFGWIE